MGENLFKLRWDAHQENLSNNLHDQMMHNQFCDVTLLAADGELFNGHKNILAASSPYFHKIFSQMPEGKQGFIFLKGVSSATLEKLMQFMYSGEVTITFEELSDLTSLAKELQIKGLAKKNPNSEFTASSTEEVQETSTAYSSSPPERPVSVTTKSAEPVQSRISNDTASETAENDKNSIVLLHRIDSSSNKRRQSIPEKSSKRQKMFKEPEEDKAEDSETEEVEIEKNEDDIFNELLDEQADIEVKLEEFSVTENGQDQHTNTSPAAESSGLMCMMSKVNRPMLVIDDFVYYKESRGHAWRCRKALSKNRCRATLTLDGRIPIFKGTHNHESEAASIDKSKLIPYDPSLLNVSSATPS